MTRTPQDTFLSDQALATAREAATDPGTVPVAITAANGEQCTWCDCPLGPDSPHNQRGYRCPGCPEQAKHVVSTFAGPNLRYDFPACGRHTTDIVASIAQLVGGTR
ncbi:hypothetical protein [Streptomyces sp. AMCC400023]|uniref:hypothetical protein n=1 Tax=Streptomyces sp. AMCC400023 TaxID=2056258 RepID=UPI001F22DBD7|nr:hypothetical protein [Streptomyces sp. AMCC400023]UJV41595.1 hypothetical protein CVT30_18590 [Streptomyces sp. AMCC400023]